MMLGRSCSGGYVFFPSRRAGFVYLTSLEDASIIFSELSAAVALLRRHFSFLDQDRYLFER
jgi:hypothetical protein